MQEVELDRQEVPQGSRLEIAHDGYARRLGFLHRRLLLLSQDGRELRGEDMLVPAERRRKPQPCAYTLRFHLGLDIEPTLTADKQGAVLRLLPHGALWQFRVSEGAVEIEESCWVDAEGQAPPGAATRCFGEGGRRWRQHRLAVPALGIAALRLRSPSVLGVALLPFVLNRTAGQVPRSL